MRLPDDSHRHSIFGKTGSGKTVAGLWALEKRSWRKMPWTIIDFKRDTSIAKIPRLEEIDITSSSPKKAGLYVTRPLPHETDEVEQYLWSVWSNGNHGLFIDEGFMIDRFSKALRAILTQGRSLRVPVIALSQRPSWLSPFLMSESDFLQLFFMTNPSDIKKMTEWIPYDGNMKQNYSSYYYDVGKGRLDYLLPVPAEDEIMDRFDRGMARRIHLFRGIANNAK